MAFIPAEHLESVCKPGTPGCCAFLMSHHPPEFVCAKGDRAMLQTIRRRLAEGTMSARGDNCAGPPGYEVLPWSP